MLKLNDVTKIYQTASKEKVTALSNVSLSIDKSGIVFIVGQSGRHYFHISIFYAMYDYVLVLNDFSYHLFRCTHRKFITANKTVCQYYFL